MTDRARTYAGRKYIPTTPTPFVAIEGAKRAMVRPQYGGHPLADLQLADDLSVMWESPDLATGEENRGLMDLEEVLGQPEEQNLLSQSHQQHFGAMVPGLVYWDHAIDEPPLDAQVLSSVRTAIDGAISQFLSEGRVLVLVPKLHNAELRQMLAGVIIDLSNACKEKDLLKVAEELNGWSATLEELVEFRGKRDEIDKALQDMEASI